MRRASLALAAVLCACSGTPPRVPAPRPVPVDPPELSLDSFLPEQLDAVGVTLTLQGEVRNPNPVDLSISRYRYAVELEGRIVASGQTAGRLALPRGASAPVRIPVRLQWVEVPGFLGLLVARESVPLRVTGSASVPTPRGVLELPYAVEGAVVLPKLPAVALRDAAVRESSVFQTVVELHVQVQNPNAFALPTGRLAYDLSVAGVPVAQAASYSLGTVPPGGSATVVIPVRFSTLGAAAGVFSGAMNGRGDVALTGHAGYGALEVALDARTSLGR